MDSRLPSHNPPRVLFACLRKDNRQIPAWWFFLTGIHAGHHDAQWFINTGIIDACSIAGKPPLLENEVLRAQSMSLLL